ncbi:cytochrome P450, partial [Streptomyces durbertensis]|nr:cytochrome P450 [Streptomyces durbertensis]
FCLGAGLARLEMRILLRELLTRLPGVRACGDPVLVPSSFDHRVASLPFAFD